MDRIIEQKHRWKQSYLLYGLGGVALVVLLIWGFAGSCHHGVGRNRVQYQ